MSRRLVAIMCVVLAGPILSGCATANASSPAARSLTRAATSSPVTPPSPAPPEGTAPATTPPAPPPTHQPPIRAAGINGTTVVDGCPILRNPPCPDKPIAARITIAGPDGAMVATTYSGNDGQFTIPLKPGTYLLRFAAATGGLPRPPAPMTVVVGADRYITVTVRFDSGIR